MTGSSSAKDKRSFNLAIKEARIGHRESQYEVGLMYANGVGVPQDFSQAIYWIRQAAERGFAAAQYLLATSYGSGEGVEQDDHQALKWYLKAADQDYPKAIYKLARFYAEPHPKVAQELCRTAAKLGVPKAQFDLVTAFVPAADDPDGLEATFTWCKRAAEQGVPAAQFALGQIYMRGSGVIVDADQAQVWFRKAAHQYFPPAQVALARLDGQGLGRGGDGEVDKLKLFASERRRFSKRWGQLADSGDAHAKYCLGLMYLEGWGVPQDGEQALFWLEASARLGDLDATLALARWFEAAADFQAALPYYQQAADQRQSEACAALGRFRLQGCGAPIDDFQGLLWTMKAVALGESQATETLAKLFLEDPSRVHLAGLRQAADHGLAGAQYALGQHFQSLPHTARMISEEMTWFARAAAQGHGPAQCALGLLYLERKESRSDLSQARDWLFKAAEQGEAKAQWHLSLMLINGSGGVKKDLKHAYLLCQSAADQGFVPAQATLGILFAKMKKPEKAVEWWQAAAQQGDPEAQYNLSLAFEKGLGVEPDPELALVWLIKAAEQGVASAQSKLGLRYVTGHGVALDPIEGHKWLVLASQQGDAAAQSNVKRSQDQLGRMQMIEAQRRANSWLEAHGLS